jgi:hypothetical protein
LKYYFTLSVASRAGWGNTDSVLSESVGSGSGVPQFLRQGQA